MAESKASQEQPDQPESVGRYQIVEPLGRGAMGAVYRARDTVLDREVAVKVMAGGLVQEEAFRTRFEREARIVARISHPNVVVAYDLGYHTDGSPFIAMELLAGQDLSTVLRTRPLDADDSAAVALQVLAGLSQAHRREIVHRDVKPANIFITEDGKVKIMDFGVARLTASAVTATGAILGTAYYMSPEQVSGGKVDGRADVFSVGCVLFEMLAQGRPFEAEDMLGILYQIANAEPDFSRVPPEGQALVPFLRRALQKDSAHRYPTALEFAQDLQRHLRANAKSGWARHAADFVELELDQGSGPVLGSRPSTEAEAPPAKATIGLLTHLYHFAPTAMFRRSSEEPTTTGVRGDAPRPVDRPGGFRMAALAGIAAVVVAAVWWWWPQARTPEPAVPPAATAAVRPPAPQEPDTGAGEAPAATVPADPTEAAAEPSAPAAPRPGKETGTSEPAPVARAPRATPRPAAKAPPAQRVTAPPRTPAPAPEPRPAQAPAEPPRVAEAPAPRSAPRPAEPAPDPEAAPAPRVAPPVAAAAAPGAAAARTPPASAPLAASPTAITPAPAPAAPTAVEAAPRPSPLTVGTSQGQRFDGRRLPATVRLGFGVEPDTPSPGGRSSVSALLRNRGKAVVQVRQVVVTTVSGDDRRTETEVGHTQVAPGQEATVWFRTIEWPQGPPWSLEVVVHTRAGETWTNTVRWQ